MTMRNNNATIDEIAKKVINRLISDGHYEYKTDSLVERVIIEMAPFIQSRKSARIIGPVERDYLEQSARKYTHILVSQVFAKLPKPGFNHVTQYTYVTRNNESVIVQSEHLTYDELIQLANYEYRNGDGHYDRGDEYVALAASLYPDEHTRRNPWRTTNQWSTV